MANFKELLPKVKAMIFDVDGVLSTATILLYQNGEPMRTINTKDGYALHYAVLKGFPVAIITGGKTEAVRIRFEDLGIQDVHTHVHMKVEKFNEFIDKYQLNPDEVLYMGDDIPDYEVMKLVGIPVCPADAVPEIKEISLYISPKNGGEGCARDIVEQVLKAQGKWMDDKAAFGW
ncbi:MAG: HAD-IIIA family hydrolase [Paludibacteraceae bacterium]|nr:HAD-IIIA family hydrolase [Paludibacteraceae bacterium]MBN2786919.1 HAD-IIIA family hydrolase [Paludibacteraceae bacterium]